MSEAGRQAALESLAGARTALARVHPTRDPEDVAADLVEAWSAIETALRSLLGGSPLGGQDLVREVRRREMLTLTQAHALLDFLTVHERLNDQSYKPTDPDIAAARTAVTQLEGALASPQAAAAAPAPPPAPPPPAKARGAPRPAQPAAATQPAAAAAAPDATERAPRWRALAALPVWGWVLIGILAVGFAGGAAALIMRGGDELGEGRRLLREGRREAARGEFERVVRQNPANAEAHLFLARMARQEGSLDQARQHAERAIRADQHNGLAHREMGVILYTMERYEAARRFLERAILLRPDDPTAQGMMGCTAIRLGYRDVGVRLITRAGPGPWSECAR